MFVEHVTHEVRSIHHVCIHHEVRSIPPASTTHELGSIDPCLHPPPKSYVTSIVCIFGEHHQVLSPSPQRTTQKFRSTNRVCKLKVRALPPSMNRVASAMCGFGFFPTVDGTTWQTLISIGCHGFPRAVFVVTGWTLAQNS